MPWHLLFESFNPAAVSGLCHAMGSVGVLFSSCEDLMVVNLVSWSSSARILVSSGHDESLGWFDATGPWLALRIAAAWPRNLGHWRGGTMGGGWQGARQGLVQGCWEMSTYSYLLVTSYSYITKNTQKLLFWNSVAIRNPEFVETLIDCFISWDVIPQPDSFRPDPVVRAGSWVNRIVLLTGRVWGPKRWETNWWLVIQA